MALSLSACDTDISGNLGEKPSTGRADFTTFVAIGDSLTAGYADSALYRPAQENSYPAIMAQQFELVGGDAFSQPLMPVGATGKLSLTGSSEIGNLTNHRLMLTATGNPESPAAPRPISRQQTTSIDTRVGNGGFNNLGVPGAKLYHVPFPGYGTLNGAVVDAGGANPFFTRFSSSDGSPPRVAWVKTGPIIPMSLLTGLKTTSPIRAISRTVFRVSACRAMRKWSRHLRPAAPRACW